MTTEEKLNRFLETSIEDARKRSHEDIEKYSQALDAEFEEYKYSINSQIEETLKAECEKIRTLTNRELCEKQIEIKRNISKKQCELKEKLFNEVQDNLSAFMRTSAYQQLLVKQIHEAVAFAGNDEVTIYIDPSDDSLLSSLRSLTGVPIEISTYSFNGGIRAIIPSKNILIDNSFEKKLAECKDSFTFTGGNING